MEAGSYRDSEALRARCCCQNCCQKPMRLDVLRTRWADEHRIVAPKVTGSSPVGHPTSTSANPARPALGPATAFRVMALLIVALLFLMSACGASEEPSPESQRVFGRLLSIDASSVSIANVDFLTGDEAK